MIKSSLRVEEQNLNNMTHVLISSRLSRGYCIRIIIFVIVIRQWYSRQSNPHPDDSVLSRFIATYVHLWVAIRCTVATTFDIMACTLYEPVAVCTWPTFGDIQPVMQYNGSTIRRKKVRELNKTRSRGILKPEWVV